MTLIISYTVYNNVFYYSSWLRLLIVTQFPGLHPDIVRHEDLGIDEWTDGQTDMQCKIPSLCKRTLNLR